LSFYTYNPTEITTAEINSGKTHTLNPLSGWSLDRKSGSDGFLLKLPASFTATSSNLVWKIDSSKYTFNGGNKMDRDGNGVPGEAIYDDVFGYLSVSGITNTTIPILPKNAVFSIDLSQAFPSRTFATATATDTTATTMTILSASDITESFLTAADKDDLLKMLVDGIKVEKFAESDGKWTPAFSASFNSTNHSIIIEDFKATHMTGYRVVFEKGSIKLETPKEYFGVKQRIKIDLGGEIVSEEKTSKKRIEGNPSDLYYNSKIRGFVDLQGTVDDYPGTVSTTTTYTHSWTWTPGWEKQKISMTTAPNPSYSATAHQSAVENDVTAANGLTTNEDNYLSDNPIVLTISSTPVDIDNADYMGYLYYSKTASDIILYYNQFHSCNPTTRPTASTTGSVSNSTTPTYTPTNPITDGYFYSSTNTSGSNSDNGSGWKWGSPQSYGTVSTTSSSTTDPDHGDRSISVISISSIDKNNQNIVLRIEIGPNSGKGSDNVTTRYYAKELDLAAFKNNFKIYYSAGGDSNPTESRDAIEIGIEKVAFKQEKNAQYGKTSDTFVNTTEAPKITYSGYNVIYITLDKNYTKNTKIKELYIGSGFGYNDNINVFSSPSIWSNKGFRTYNIGTAF